MASGGVPEGEARPEGGAGPGVGEAEHVRHHVAARVKARDRAVVQIEHLRVFVGDRAALGTEAAQCLRHHVVRRFERAQVGMRRTGIAAVAVVWVIAAVELGVDAPRRIAVENLELLFQSMGVDLGPFGQLGDAVRPRSTSRGPPCQG